MFISLSGFAISYSCPWMNTKHLKNLVDCNKINNLRSFLKISIKPLHKPSTEFILQHIFSCLVVTYLLQIGLCYI